MNMKLSGGASNNHTHTDTYIAPQMKHFIAQAINITFYVLFQSVDEAYKNKNINNNKCEIEKESERKKNKKNSAYIHIFVMARS